MMKTIGLIGGMSWESTVGYYQAINQGVKQRLGGFHSAKIAMISLDFAEIEKLQQVGDWDGASNILGLAARQLQAAGADGLVICTNTMHKVAEQVQSSVDIPLLHIADATAQVLKNDGVQRVGLLGTAFTMQQDFYKGRLIDHGLNVVIPSADGCELIHHVIYQELCLGVINENSRKQYQRVIAELAEEGAQAVILGCTEIGLLVQQSHTSIALYDTTVIHAQAAVNFMLEP